MRKVLLSTLLVGSTLAFCGAQAQQPPKAAQQPTATIPITKPPQLLVKIGAEPTAKPMPAPASPSAALRVNPKAKPQLKAEGKLIVPKKND